MKLKKSRRRLSGGIPSYIAGIASAQPVPGGGSAAALTAALGAACVLKAIAFTKIEKIPLPSRRRFIAVRDGLRRAVGFFEAAVAKDSAAYAAVAAARRAGLGLDSAMLAAAAAPSAVAARARECLGGISAVKSALNKNFASDVFAAELLLSAAARSSERFKSENLASCRNGGHISGRGKIR